MCIVHVLVCMYISNIKKMYASRCIIYILPYLNITLFVVISNKTAFIFNFLLQVEICEILPLSGTLPLPMKKYIFFINVLL